MVGRKAKSLFTLLALALVPLAAIGAIPQQEKPPQPFGPDSYSGQVSVLGVNAPPGTWLLVCIDDCSVWQSSTVAIESGRSYSQLLVNPADRSLVGHPITFYLANEYGRIKAEQSAEFRGATDFFTLDLNFREPAPGATPTPTVTPTASLPVPGDPMVTAIPRIALVVGGAAVLAGGLILLVLRRRAV